MGAIKLLKLKKMCLSIISICLLIFFLRITVDPHFYCSSFFFSFDDMPKILLPRTPNVSSIDECFHFYEKQQSKERMELNVSDVEVIDYYAKSTDVAIGGAWKPKDCSSKYHVNIIVPYRQREEQLRVFLHYFHRFLQLQQIDYRIIIVEQSAQKKFNRGKLFNVGFVEAQKRFPSDCYIFHDVISIKS